ncbi:MAG: nitroreductase family protein [Anaerolineae bacterium]|jgi:coenzyme F420-0:L-glutamate ligase / coenzyme F420-1:gamma-L-glutamate ligase|nr:nitroreductase family protein [Anaerolineae bacterium]MBT7070626.1 nitroreductase family protein [Anaerolineae bacterium]MBT7326254.1 nitroreductase family protein [Anaerolineae bacterium]MBT7602612.1 nitroreductase family protein [Anaerolineae bacterium]
MNELHHFLQTRRSIRRFKPDPVPAPVIKRILATAIFAPSAHNLQPWRFVHVESDLSKEKLGNALTEKMRTDMDAEGADPAQIQKRVEISIRRIDEAPVIILLCRDVTAIRKSEPEEEIMGIQSAALGGLQLMLAAHAEGVGANWICWNLYAQAETRLALDLPKSWQAQAMIFLGYADEEPKKASRKSVDELLTHR